MNNVDFNKIVLSGSDIDKLKTHIFVNKSLNDHESELYSDDKLNTKIHYYPKIYINYIKYYLYCYISNIVDNVIENVNVKNIIDIVDDVNKMLSEDKQFEIDDDDKKDLEHLIPLFHDYLIPILHIIYSMNCDINNIVIRIAKLFGNYGKLKNIDDNTQYYCFLKHLEMLNGDKCLVSIKKVSGYGEGKNNDNIKSLINSTVRQLNSNYNSNILQMYVSHILPTITFDKNITETNITEIKKQLNKFIKNNNNNIDNKVNDYISQVKNNLSKLNLKAQQYSFNESDSDY
jgi:hypothetical protein